MVCRHDPFRVGCMHDMMRVLVGTSHSNKSGAGGSWGPFPQVHPATPEWSPAQVRKEGSISVGEDSLNA